MKIVAEDYEPLKGFFGWMIDNVVGAGAGLPADSHPVAVLRRIEETSLSNARNGLAMAVGDIIEQTESVGGESLSRIDEGLRQAGFPTLTEVRVRFWSRVNAVLQRGIVRSEREYCALRNVVEGRGEPDRERAWAMLAAFEERVVARA
ncbi:hypothetical protein [Sphingomonas sp. G-3-2-10]|uniref:hypothetical protein n=1 Tax=Sphingomonas sp. G-3-2-10 TaxID=2728838 RepID=UPI001469F56C|nr:hypothetical protein [Sphingomonas sp. G-3-2-10]NML04218.1 hypothetical protein [Sphingomonas sp. G-3-2-10]